MSALEEYREFTAVPKTHYLPDITLRQLADAAIAELESENERLKVCAQCIHLYGAGAFCSADSPTGSSRKVYFSDSCHFAPSCWTERGTP